jgi:photosynthetic reaction center cytochrome c subunit
MNKLGGKIGMNGGPKRALKVVINTVILCLITACLVHSQSRNSGEQKPLMAEDVFKNVQLLKDIPVKEFMDTMGFFSAATGLNCIDCHDPEAGSSLAAYAIDTPLKQIARKMILMVNALNKANFGGEQMVTCYTCHRATDRPKRIPSLAEQYSAEADDPNEVEIIEKGGARPANQLSADQILDKYIQAIGGPAQLAKLTSFVAKGTYEGYDSLSEKVPIEVYAKAPNQLTTIVHTQQGDSVSTFSGASGWIAAADKLMRVLPLSGGDFEGAKMDASIWFPAGLNQEFKWRTGFPSVAIDNRPVEVIQVAATNDLGAKLYFDKQTGLLVRQLRYSETAVGIIPTQVDYSDYREVAGVKIPFHWVVTWTDGRSTVILNEIQPNASIETSRFAMPAPPSTKKSARDQRDQ